LEIVEFHLVLLNELSAFGAESLRRGIDAATPP
jgi:hypothetical protein